MNENPKFTLRSTGDEASNNAQQIGAELVVRTLETRGVTHVFGIPGAKIDSVFNALVDSTIKTIVCRHEQNAAFIAGGIGRMTGKAGVAIATSGDPDDLALIAAVARSDALKQIHQTMDAVSILRPVTKFSATVGASHQVNEVLANAFRAAESGRPGAAYVNLPMDVMTAPCTLKPLSAPVFAGPGPADSAAIKEAARLINAASNPVVFLGMLASKPANAAALQTFISKNNLPVVGTFQAAGAVGATLFDNFGGRVGQLANQPADLLLESADLVVTVGYDPVEYWPQLWNGKTQRKIVHIDVLPTDLDNCYCPCVELTGDIAQTLQALTPQLQRTQMSALSQGILEMISAQRRLLSEEAAARDGVPIHPLRLVHELKEFLSSDVTVCLDMGSFHLWIAHHLYSFRPRQVLITNGQQTLGVALPWGIAASIVRPGEKILSISGEAQGPVIVGVHVDYRDNHKLFEMLHADSIH